MSTADYKFEGWVADDASGARGNMVWKEFEPKAWEETDIDIRVTHSGVCGSDLHALNSDWGSTEYPIVVGHEIVGVAVRVGSRAEGGIQVGDVVGVGCQADACLNRDDRHCAQCAAGMENYCRGMVMTYEGRHRNGYASMGGHALHHRAPSHFVVKLPPGLDPALAAPMLCGGLTVFAPLVDHGAGPGKRVGVVGVGGLGHLAVLFARALGVDEVVGISRSEDKRAECMALGADGYIATDDEVGWETKNAGRFDLIISTVSSANIPFGGYLDLLDFDGTLVQLGAPGRPIPIDPMPLIFGRKHISGSVIGSPRQIADMFRLAVDKGVRPWIEKRPMAEANQTMLDLADSKARFRYVLVN